MVHHRNGSIRSIRLVTSATRVVESTPLCAASYGNRFCVREKPDSGHVVWRHHRRALESPDRK